MIFDILPFMSEQERESLTQHIRGIGFDNFAIDGRQVRLGRQYWMAEPCTCGSSNCDGWSLVRDPTGFLPAAY